MEGLLANLSLGFVTALSLQNVAFCFLGALIGTLIGVLPGVGPIATIAMLPPLTFSFDPVGAQTAFIPLLTLGIPPNAVMALMVGAMTIHGVIPGP